MVAAALNVQAAPEQGGGLLVPALANSLAHLLESARTDMDGDQEAAKATIARASALLRVELDRQVSTAAADVPSGQLAAWQVRRLKAFIDERLDQTIHIKDLAKVAQRSVAYFCRAFKRTFGETPHAYVIARRLDRARFLMLTTEMALSAVALSCGFTDQAHLCKLFRQMAGQSPAVWRRQRRERTVEPALMNPVPVRRSGEIGVGPVVQAPAELTLSGVRAHPLGGVSPHQSHSKAASVER
ncbi:MAG: AraC family transcriptional regulator [Caulobacteraceae bacterium]